MQANTLIDRLSILLPAGKSVLIVGQPGCGKTDIVHQVAQQIGYDLWIGHPAVADPTDAKGMPAIVDGRAEFLPYGDLRRLLEATRPTIAFLDDLGQAPASVQAAYMQLIGARRVNGHILPDCVVFVAATNRRQDKAGVSGLLEPVKSRFHTILQLEPDIDSWSAWAVNSGLPMEVISWARFRPECLTDFRPTADVTNSCCPRTLAHCAENVGLGISDVETLAGSIGQGRAIELVAFLSVWRKLPDPDAVLLDPLNAMVPTDPATLYAIAGALASRASCHNVGRVIAYADRLPEAFGTLLVLDARRRVNNGKPGAFESTPEFKKWAAVHGSALV